MLTILGVNFGRELLGRPETLENKAEKIAAKICHQNSLRNSPANFPKIRQAKIKNTP